MKSTTEHMAEVFADLSKEKMSEATLQDMVNIFIAVESIAGHVGIAQDFSQGIIGDIRKHQAILNNNVSRLLVALQK